MQFICQPISPPLCATEGCSQLKLKLNIKWPVWNCCIQSAPIRLFLNFYLWSYKVKQKEYLKKHHKWSISYVSRSHYPDAIMSYLQQHIVAICEIHCLYLTKLKRNIIIEKKSLYTFYSLHHLRSFFSLEVFADKQIVLISLNLGRAIWKAVGVRHGQASSL